MIFRKFKNKFKGHADLINDRQCVFGCSFYDESTRIRTLYDFDFSRIARKKSAPCHKLMNPPLQEESKQDSVIYSELVEVPDEKCLKQLKRKRQGSLDIKRRTSMLVSPVYKK